MRSLRFGRVRGQRLADRWDCVGFLARTGRVLAFVLVGSALRSGRQGEK